MNTISSHLTVLLITLISSLLIGMVAGQVNGQRRLSPLPGRGAVVVDERLSVLRASPDTSGKLLRRIGRGRPVAIRAQSRSRDGILFYRVAVTRRTGGWIQRDAVVSVRQPGEDQRLMRLIKGSEDFDLIARGRIFLDTFPHSPLRPAVLLLFGLEAEKAAERLSRDALRRLDEEEMNAGGAPTFSYFLNYNGLDRYNRQGVRFVFDRAQKRFYYEGAAWRELIRRHPRSLEATEARKRLRG
ncbi:MAG: hypothetical protein ACREBG_17970 [Pyrinomonadaceae bacterium]